MGPGRLPACRFSATQIRTLMAPASARTADQAGSKPRNRQVFDRDVANRCVPRSTWALRPELRVLAGVAVGPTVGLTLEPAGLWAPMPRRVWMNPPACRPKACGSVPGPSRLTWGPTFHLPALWRRCPWCHQPASVRAWPGSGRSGYCLHQLHSSGACGRRDARGGGAWGRSWRSGRHRLTHPWALCRRPGPHRRTGRVSPCRWFSWWTGAGRDAWSGSCAGRRRPCVAPCFGFSCAGAFSGACARVPAQVPRRC